uniref:Uncharacterized protein n=1 Tax=Heterorhabditis bacteriophora TaxID=37862 RepID=A0A1I7X3A9_HETBA
MVHSKILSTYLTSFYSNIIIIMYILFLFGSL